MLKIGIERWGLSWRGWDVVFITYAVISSYVTGPSWRFSNHGFMQAEKRVLMEFFFRTLHSH